MEPSILVVDDEADLLATYRRLLRRLGQPVIAAATRGEALEVIRSRPLSLVITDVRLSDGDGLDVVRAARTTGQPPPVIVVTGYASETSRTHAVAAGASAYVAKPFSIAGFADLVRAYLPADGAAAAS
jgi:CheY-like chemotaxis protein